MEIKDRESIETYTNSTFNIKEHRIDLRIKALELAIQILSRKDNFSIPSRENLIDEIESLYHIADINLKYINGEF